MQNSFFIGLGPIVWMSNPLEGFNGGSATGSIVGATAAIALFTFTADHPYSGL